MEKGAEYHEHPLLWKSGKAVHALENNRMQSSN